MEVAIEMILRDDSPERGQDGAVKIADLRRTKHGIPPVRGS
jgi:hypothetical protein